MDAASGGRREGGWLEVMWCCSPVGAHGCVARQRAGETVEYGTDWHQVNSGGEVEVGGGATKRVWGRGFKSRTSRITKKKKKEKF